MDHPKMPKCYHLKPIRWLDMHYLANVLHDENEEKTRREK